VATEQDVWRAAHVAGANAALDDLGMAALRQWTADRMRDLPYAVWDYSDCGTGGMFVPAPLRPSFHIALECAAGRLAQGKPAERQENEDDVSTR
jgi:hypothetical protein